MSDVPDRLNAALQGRYRIERQLGEGGMATVYLADDLEHNRNVALKVFRPELAAVVGAERFLAEIETTANLQHPHILPLFDSGEARIMVNRQDSGGPKWIPNHVFSLPSAKHAKHGIGALWRGISEGVADLPPRAVPHPMLVPAPVEGREGRASSGTRATA